MQSFTKIEISWIAVELEELSKALKQQAPKTADQAVGKIFQLRSEQYADISRRLRDAVEKGDKRIEIK